MEKKKYGLNPIPTISNGAINGHVESRDKAPDEEADGVTNPASGKCITGMLSFTIVYGLGAMFTGTISVYLSSQITTLEKAFGFSSAKSGILLSANDIGFLVAVLFASHFLHRGHIPRILATCILIFGISGILTSLPHFIAEERLPHFQSFNKSSSNSSHFGLCIPGSRNDSGFAAKCQGRRGADVKEASDDNQWVMILISVLMVIQGLAKAPRQALSTTYIDNNVKKTKTGFYLGIGTTFGIFGPFLALTAGGVFNKMPVDLKETQLSPRDPRWIGAWWLGFIAFGVVSIFTSIPVFFFPRGKPSPEHKSIKDADEGSTPFLKILKDLPKSCYRIFSKPVFTLMVVSIILYLFGVMALGSFGPKYLENQFNIPTWRANIILGLSKLITTAIGTIGGGVISMRLRLDRAGCLRMSVITRVIATLLGICNFFFGCDNQTIYGSGSDGYKVFNGTGVSCDCSGSSFLPVCVDNKHTFYSPCYAGCQAETKKGFSDCSLAATGEITTGMCDSGCPYLIPFVVVNAVAFIVGTMAIAPYYVAVLRTVEVQDRALAVGFQSFLMALLVFLPAPIVFGKVFDSMCLEWKGKCGGRGSACALYDITDMRLRMVGIDTGLRLMSCVLIFFAFLLARRQEKKTDTGPSKDVIILSVSPRNTS